MLDELGVDPAQVRAFVKITFHPDVYKQLQRLPCTAFATALDEIIGLANDPRPGGAKKLVGSGNDDGVRIGEYRIVYEVDDAHGAVTLLTVAKAQRRASLGRIT